jgi:hypothetical protein
VGLSNESNRIVIRRDHNPARKWILADLTVIDFFPFDIVAVSSRCATSGLEFLYPRLNLAEPTADGRRVRATQAHRLWKDRMPIQTSRKDLTTVPGPAYDGFDISR